MNHEHGNVDKETYARLMKARGTSWFGDILLWVNVFAVIVIAIIRSRM